MKNSYIIFDSSCLYLLSVFYIVHESMLFACHFTLSYSLFYNCNETFSSRLASGEAISEVMSREKLEQTLLA